MPLPQQGQCFCSGDRLTYQCLVVGGVLTRWMGTMCDSPINLAHVLFSSPSGANSTCASNTNIVAKSVNNMCPFTSQLNITASSDLNGRTVECADTNSNVIGNHTIMVARKY